MVVVETMAVYIDLVSPLTLRSSSLSLHHPSPRRFSLSPSYCSRLMRASAEEKSRAFPWLAPAIARAGPCGCAGGGDDIATALAVEAAVAAASAARVEMAGAGVDEGMAGVVGRSVRSRVGGGSFGGGSDCEINEDDERDIINERGLCRVVQAAAAAGAAAG